MAVKNYEDAFARLQDIVKQLEDGDLPLQQSLALFEEGIKLFRQCQGELQKAEGKISVLVKSLEEGWEAVPFDI
ncbi:MAG: exodeoxyribonuclease VII small subunit [Ignavibacteriales bacterium]